MPGGTRTHARLKLFTMYSKTLRNNTELNLHNHRKHTYRCKGKKIGGKGGQVECGVVTQLSFRLRFGLRGAGMHSPRADWADWAGCGCWGAGGSRIGGIGGVGVGSGRA